MQSTSTRKQRSSQPKTEKNPQSSKPSSPKLTRFACLRAKNPQSLPLRESAASPGSGLKDLETKDLVIADRIDLEGLENRGKFCLWCPLPPSSPKRGVCGASPLPSNAKPSTSLLSSGPSSPCRMRTDHGLPCPANYPSTYPRAGDRDCNSGGYHTHVARMAYQS
jgi:hypothetical protein